VARRVEIVLKDGFDMAALSGAKLVTGFKGFGATGYIATRYIASKLGMERVGVILTKYMPEFAFRDEYGLAFPFEIFYRPDPKLVVIVNHDLPDPRDRRVFAEVLVDWMKKVGISEAILIGGLDKKLKSGEEKMRWLANSHYAEKLGEPLMDKWLLIIGPLALLLMYSELKGLPALAVLPYAEAMRYDPYAAAVAVEKVGQLVGVEIDASELYEEARKFEEELEKLSKLEETRKAVGKDLYM